MMTARLSFVAAIALLAGCATAPASRSSRPANCPDNAGGYVDGVATSDFVKSCLGNPSHIDKNPDGRYVYLYNLRSGTVITFLFDSSGKLIRTRGYGRTDG
jgi:hypothetical protein